MKKREKEATDRFLHAIKIKTYRKDLPLKYVKEAINRIFKNRYKETLK